jgi:hypothetical protein
LLKYTSLPTTHALTQDFIDPMNQPCVIDAQHREFSSYWGQLSSGQESPYRINTAFAELQGTLAGRQPTTELPERGVKDYSFVVVRSGVPLIGCCLIFQELIETAHTVGCRSLFATSEFDATRLNATTNNLETDLFACLNAHLNKLMEKLQPDLVEFFDTLHCGVMSPVSHWLLASGARPIMCPVKVIDLKGAEQRLRQGLDKTHLDVPPWGQQNLEFQVLETAEDLDLSLCASLQLGSQGQTMGPPHNESGFQEQASNSYYRWLLDSRKAFVIQALREGKLIASSTFSMANGTAQYVASILSPDVNSKAALQSLIWQGVTHARSLGLDRFELTSSQLQGSGEEGLLMGFGGETQSRFKLLLTRTPNF